MPFITNYPKKVSEVVSDYNYGILTAKQAEWKIRGILYLSNEDKIDPDMIYLIGCIHEMYSKMSDNEV
jgi:hypothetical protein